MALKARLLLDRPDERTVKNFALVITSLLVVELIIWDPAAIALAWPIEKQTSSGGRIEARSNDYG